MSGKQRRLRQKRRIEIISKHQKRARQRLRAKYGKPKLWYPIPSMLMLDTATFRWFRTIEARLVDTINQYNELREKSEALLEGS